MEARLARLAPPPPPAPPPAPFPPQTPLAAPFRDLPALAELGLPRGVPYQAVWRRTRIGAGTWTNVPLDPHAAPVAQRRAAADEAATWGSLAEAAAGAARARATGVGYALRAMPPAADDRVGGGEPAPWAVGGHLRPGARTLPVVCPAGDLLAGRGGAGEGR